MKKKILRSQIVDWFNSLSDETKQQYFNSQPSLEDKNSIEIIIEKYYSLKSLVKIWFDNIPEITKRNYFGGYITFQSSYDVIIVAYEEAKKTKGVLLKKG